MEELTPQQDRFCRLYTQNEELFSNATLSYAEAYSYELGRLSDIPEYNEKGDKIPRSSERDKAYDSCSANASRLLRNDKIQDKVTLYLNELMKDTVVDSQLAKVIMQDRKLESKVSAIREYNKLRNRIKEDMSIVLTKIISVDE